jgi:hypothetical protein
VCERLGASKRLTMKRGAAGKKLCRMSIGGRLARRFVGKMARRTRRMAKTRNKIRRISDARHGYHQSLERQ